jgi:hypothetical protein
MFKIEFATDNAAFVEDGADEVAGVLRHVIELVEGGYLGGPLTDSNGNQIGAWSLSLPEPELEEPESVH